MINKGKGSWYSQYNGKYHWHDGGDKPNSNALGVPDYCQGVSFYNRHTLGKWFKVTAPNGHVSIEQQTEIGPAPWTGRLIDISAVAAERFGYTPGNRGGLNPFPTNAEWHWEEVHAPVYVDHLSAREQALVYWHDRSKESGVV